MSEICGFICPSEKFCEKKCNRLDFDNKSVRIRELHGWVCGHVSKFEGWDRYVPAQNGHKVAVVGAGPAGLSCAHFLARLGYRVDILDKAQKPGGMLTYSIPKFRLPEEIIDREIDGLSLPGMNFQYGKELGKDFTVEDLQKEYKAVFIAPGLWSGRTLNITGSKKAKAQDALSFLATYREKGKAKVEKNVLIIGGGSVGADAALAAKDSGAKKVVLVCLEGENEMPCLPGEIEEMKQKGIEIQNCWGPKEFVSDNKLSFVCCTSVFDKSGNFCPAFDEKKSMELDFDQIIMAVGQSTESSLAKYLKKAFGTDGLLKVKEGTMEIIDHTGVFAGGDIVRGAGTVVQAIGDGRKAAGAIDNMISKG